MELWPYPPVEADRIDPFDGERTETQYVILGGDVPTHAFAERDKRYEEPMWDSIPMGYKILRMAQKVAVLRGGDLVRQWPVLHRDPRVDPIEQAPGTTLYLDNWRRSVCGFLVMAPPAKGTRLEITRPEDPYDEAAALTRAAEISRQGTAVLLYAYDAENWH